MAREIAIKRVYAPPETADGFRVLVDRVWPRGVSKERAAIDAWYREVAPSDALRTWFGHEPRRWKGFAERYREELRDPAVRERLRALLREAGDRRITLVYSAADEQHNQAVVLRDVLRRFR
jgi:uncharacterized protein YeaO (DUF488 family)